MSYLATFPQKDTAHLFLWALQYLASSQSPAQQMLCGMETATPRCTTFGRLTAEKLAPAGIKVDYDAWLFRHLSKSNRKAMLQEQPGIDQRAVFTLLEHPIELGADPHQEKSED